MTRFYCHPSPNLAQPVISQSLGRSTLERLPSEPLKLIGDKILLTMLTMALILVMAPVVAGEEPFSADRLLANGQPVVVDLHADWCPTCRAQAPIVRCWRCANA